MVRPHLEYDNVIWHPRFQLDKTVIEKVQRRATKLIPTLRHEPYEARLWSLKLPSIDYRRRRGDMLQVFRILTAPTDSTLNYFSSSQNKHAPEVIAKSYTKTIAD